MIKEIDKISHYCWINDKKILFTHLKDKNSAEYQIYNIQSKKIKKIGLNLNLDGHPMIHPKIKIYLYLILIQINMVFKNL